MKIRTNVKAGGRDCPDEICGGNHNEKLANDSGSIEQKKTFAKKLRLSKETIKELKDTDLKLAVGGAATPTYWFTCPTASPVC